MNNITAYKDILYDKNIWSHIPLHNFILTFHYTRNMIYMELTMYIF